MGISCLVSRVGDPIDPVHGGFQRNISGSMVSTVPLKNFQILNFDFAFLRP